MQFNGVTVPISQMRKQRLTAHLSALLGFPTLPWACCKVGSKDSYCIPSACSRRNSSRGFSYSLFTCTNSQMLSFSKSNVVACYSQDRG